MVGTESRLCLFCATRLLSFSSSCRPQQWTSVRSMAVMQKRKPSRMELSPRVARSSPQKPRPSQRDGKKRLAGPFGGMNVANVRIRADGRSRISQAEEKRRSRFGNTTKKGKTDDKSRRDDFKALKMQRALSAVLYDRRTAIKKSVTEITSFGSFGLLPIVEESIAEQALRGLSQISPTPVQRVAIPALFGKGRGRRARQSVDDDVSQRFEQFLLAAETGSGKTLAYLLPALDQMKRTETIEHEPKRKNRSIDEVKPMRNPFELETPEPDEPHHTTGRPRIIILVPTSELVDQVGNLVKSLSHTIKFRSALLSASYTGKVIRNRLFSPAGIDVVVSTPHLLASITDSDPYVLARVEHLIIDEADSLLDRSFAPITGKIIDRAAPSLKQLIFCSATIPRNLDSFLRKQYPDVRRLTTPNLHAIPRRVQLSVVDVEKPPYKNNKDLACADTIWNIGRDDMSTTMSATASQHVVVFVNEREKTTELANYLASKGIDATALNRDSDQRRTSDILAPFLQEGSKSSRDGRVNTLELQDSPSDVPMSIANGAVTSGRNASTALTTNPRRGPKQLSNVHVLVTTDIASRGIDTTAVKNVILYDVPHTSIDFIHRLGRAGRMGRRGRGYVLVGKGDRRDIVREVREGMFKGQALI